MDLSVSDEMDKLDIPPKRVDTQWHVVDVLQIFFPAQELREAERDSSKQKEILLTISEFDAREYSVYDIQNYTEQLDSSIADKEDLQDVEEDANNESTDMENSSLQESQNDVHCGSIEVQRYASTESSDLHTDVVPESTYIHEEILMESRDVQGDAGFENGNIQEDTSTESMDVQEGSLEAWDLHEPPEATNADSRSTQEAQGDTSAESMEVQVDTGSESGPFHEVQDVNSEVGDGGSTPFSADSHLNTKEEVDLVSIHEHSAGQLCSHEVEWADYWNNWKDTLVNLAWVQRFSHQCKPEFQRWYAEYIHNYPNLLPQILEGLDNFVEEEQQQVEKEVIEPGDVNDDDEKKRKLDLMYEKFSVQREAVHKIQYFSSQGWVNISCCGNQDETKESLTGRFDSKEDVGHTDHGAAGDLSVQDRKETFKESDRKETLEGDGGKEILEESDSSETKGKLVATRTNKCKRAASPAKSGGRRKKSKKSGKSFSVASVIQFLQEVEEAKKDKENFSLTIEEVGAVDVGPLTDCSNVVNILNGTMERKRDSQHQEITTKGVECGGQLSKKLDTSVKSQENRHKHMEDEITVEQGKVSDNTPAENVEMALLPSMESLKEVSQRLSCIKAEEEFKSDYKSVEPNLIDAKLVGEEETPVKQFEGYEAELVGKKETIIGQSENHEVELGKEATLVKQSENYEAELVGREVTSVEHPKNHGAEFMDREETPGEQSKNYGTELVDGKETSFKQSENYEMELGREKTLVEQSENFETKLTGREEILVEHYEAKLVGKEEILVTNKRKRKRQDEEAVVEESEIHGEVVENLEVPGEVQRNSTGEVHEAGDVREESSLSWIMVTIKNFTQLAISSTLKGLFNAVFMPWQNEEVLALPDKSSPVSSFISRIRKWKENKRIFNENKNALEKFISKNRLSSAANKWPLTLQNFSVQVQTCKKKHYEKIRWSLGIYVTEEEEEGRKVTINMEDVPNREDNVVYFKKDKNYMTSAKEPPADLPPALLKYWNQRHRLFYKFDEGVKLDHESWYSATPECIAVHHALRCACSVVVDAFCGAGGNSIQFAFSCSHVIAIDIDEAKIEIARHNAEVYGVADRIEFIVGDFFQLAPTLKADVVFLSPPWGGPEYLSSPVYDLVHLSGEITASRLMEAAHKISPNVAIFLPKNSDIKQLLFIGSKTNKKISIEKNKIGRKFKALTAYFGDIADYTEDDW